MTWNTLVSIDLGLASGVSFWTYNDTDAAEMYSGEQIIGGYEGLKKWLDVHSRSLRDEVKTGRMTIIAEKWIPYPTRGHSPTLESTYPLVLEGVLIHEGLMPEYPDPRWRRSSLQYWVDGANAKIKRKKQENWLKETTDLYRTAGQMGVKHKDAQDYLSSVYHALSWFRSIDHKPTIRKYWPQGAGDD